MRGTKLHHGVSAFIVWPYYACSYTVLVHTYYYTIVCPMVINIIIIVKLTGLQSIILFLLRMSVKKRGDKIWICLLWYSPPHCVLPNETACSTLLCVAPKYQVLIGPPPHKKGRGYAGFCPEWSEWWLSCSEKWYYIALNILLLSLSGGKKKLNGGWADHSRPVWAEPWVCELCMHRAKFKWSRLSAAMYGVVHATRFSQ